MYLFVPFRPSEPYGFTWKNGVEYIGDAKLNISRPPFTCSKSISETLEQGVKYVRT